jgi:uncharacterized protein involved in exopolysaccharide biosynthesis
MTLRETLEALRRRHVLLEVAAAVSVVLALAVGLLQGTDYRADTRVLLIQDQVFLPGDQGVLTQQKLNLLALNYSQIVPTPEFVRVAIERAGADRTTSNGITVEGGAVQNSAIVQMSIRGSSKSRVLSTANALQSSLLQDLKNDQSKIDESQRVGARVLETPVVHVSSANLVFTVFAALIVGLMLAATVALLLENE